MDKSHLAELECMHACMLENVSKFAKAAAGLQVMARTICMQFEGNWTPVTDIVVDKVGKYAYVIGSPHDAAATPVVMDVVLDVRTKVQYNASAPVSSTHACMRNAQL